MIYIYMAVLVVISILVLVLSLRVNVRVNESATVDVAAANVATGVLDHPSKCFDCESSYADQKDAWRGQKTRCFSCELDYAARGGPETPFDAHPIRYY